MESDNNKYLKNFFTAFLICAAVGAIIAIIVKQTKSKFTAEITEASNVKEEVLDVDVKKVEEKDVDIVNEDVTAVDVEQQDIQTINTISQDYVLENYEKPMLKNRTTNIIEHGNFVILQQTSDVLERVQLNAVLTTMYFPTLHVYVIRGIYGESIVNCFVDAKTLEFVRVNSDYTAEPQLSKSGKKQKPNQPLEEVLKFDISKQYYPDSLQQMINEGQDSFLQRTTMNTYGVDSKRLY